MTSHCFSLHTLRDRCADPESLSRVCMVRTLRSEGRRETMLAARGYRTKKDLKDAVGKEFRYTETSVFGPEYREDGVLTVVGPSAYERKWYAQVWMVGGKITKVK